MKYLKIQNNGELDIRLVALMGGTTKAGDTYKLGQFGTGLKYTLAFLFRNNIDFHIISGDKKVGFEIQKENIQNMDFNIICIDGHRTSITTNMGTDWKAWMVIREIYSNALDEGGALYEIVDETQIIGEPDKTTFYIQLTPEILQVYNDWTKYFIVGRMPMYETKKFALHPSNDVLRIYKQGILIHEDKTQKALFNYDIKDAQINELREYKGIKEWDLSKLIFSIEDEAVVRYFLENLNRENRSDADLFEARIDLVYWQDNGQLKNAWKDVLGKSKVIHTEAKETIIAKQANVDLTHTIEVPKNFYKALTQSFEGIGALRVADKVNEFYEIHSEELSLLTKQALVILEEADYFIHPELTFVFGEFGCATTLAQINIDAKEIMISQKMKDKSLFEFCAMLVEENEHFQTGLKDETREFQQHFINLYTKTMLSKAEIKL